MDELERILCFVSIICMKASVSPPVSDGCFAPCYDD